MIDVSDYFRLGSHGRKFHRIWEQVRNQTVAIGLMNRDIFEPVGSIRISLHVFFCYDSRRQSRT